jgi:type IV secretion system protein VirB6
MWLGALLLLLGTVGVLVTARIALAVLLALGPCSSSWRCFPAPAASPPGGCAALS